LLITFLFFFFKSRLVNKDTGLEQAFGLNQDKKSEIEDFFKDFPRPEKTDVVSSWLVKDNGQKGASLVLESKESAADIAQFYQINLTRLSWETALTDEREAKIINFSQGEFYGFIGIIEEKEKTTVSITMKKR